jgi:hypothetical protein
MKKSEKAQLTRFASGDIARFELYLSQDGFLSVAVVNDSEMASEEISLFDKMLIEGEDKIDRTFLPW